ncbi:hypothetical protein AAC387_Pa09g1530 [Persea americana]
MLKVLNLKLRRLYSRLRWPLRRHMKAKIIIRRFGRPKLKPQSKFGSNDHLNAPESSKPIRIATFNAAMFSMAPVVPQTRDLDCREEQEEDDYQLNSEFRQGLELDIRGKSADDHHPKSILKQSPPCSYAVSSPAEGTTSKQQRFKKSKLRVSINLPHDEISRERQTRQLNFTGDDKEAGPSSSGRDERGKAYLRSSWSFSTRKAIDRRDESWRRKTTFLQVLKEVDADILALQDVKAYEERGMKPLSDLADALGMKYVFAESWAPEYGNAILSKWPIKRWKVQKICDDTDFRNVLKATVDVPLAGEVTFHCTHLDHLDEDWRMKQINAIIQSDDYSHILAGGLNSLDETDYSAERWTDIVKYYEEIGKPTPKVEVMKFLKKKKKYNDAKLFAGECESVVMIAKGQDVQGTCKYGTRVDYILSSPDSRYKFVPGSYAVISSRGTSDHHIVKVDIVVAKETENVASNRQQLKKKVVKATNPLSSGIWTINS